MEKQGRNLGSLHNTDANSIKFKIDSAALSQREENLFDEANIKTIAPQEMIHQYEIELEHKEIKPMKDKEIVFEEEDETPRQDVIRKVTRNHQNNFASAENPYHNHKEEDEEVMQLPAQ